MWISVVLTLVLLPVRIIERGFLPPDDALRHAAKAVSGKAWSEILVLRPEITIDHNPGWHTLLTLLHRVTGWEPKALVLFSVISMFILFAISPLPWLRRRPESWLVAMAVVMLAFPYFAERSFLGRPLLLTMAVTFVLLSAWTQPAQRPSKALIGATIVLIALSTWIHGSWYLFVLIPAVFVLASGWRHALLLSGCWAVGTLLGAVFTGQPFTFLYQSGLIPLLALRPEAHINSLVGEFQRFPLKGAYPALILIAVILACRKMTRKPLGPVRRDPVFWLALVGLLLGFRVLRFWLDWGLPALALWSARQVEDFSEVLDSRDSRPGFQLGRLAITTAAAVALLIFVCSDRNARWSQYRFEALDARRADHAEWLPAPGGILYSVNLSVFYQTFFTNPHGPWRYALGFEPSFMTRENLAVYDDLWRSLNALKACRPWVERMTPADRLVLLAPREIRPAIPELEWHYAVANTWIGRRPQTGEDRRQRGTDSLHPNR